jgi:tripartite-type tricarboxylate transporter receptor subunit TctC
MNTLHKLGATLLLALAAGGACAQAAFPAKPIRILVGSPPGGGNDVVARLVAQKMNPGQPVVVENRPGAASMISAELVAKSPPDGHTLLLVSQSVLTVSPILTRVTSFDPMKDFTAVALLGSAPLVLVVGPTVPANSVKELIALAKAKPGALDFGSGGIGTTPYMAASLFMLTTGTKLTSVPFQGEQAAMTEIIGGRIPLMFGNAAAAMPYVKSGRLRGLAVTSSARTNFAPELPTVAEAGVPGFEIATWLGLVAPSGTPRDVVAKLNAEALRSLDTPEVKDKLTAQGFAISRETPEQFGKFILAEHAKWSRVIKDANIKGE